MTIDLKPLSRKEMYLNSIDKSGHGVIPSRPLTRIEMYLDSINDEIAKKAQHIVLTFTNDKIYYQDRELSFNDILALIEDKKNVVDLHADELILNLSINNGEAIEFSTEYMVDEKAWSFRVIINKNNEIKADDMMVGGSIEALTVIISEGTPAQKAALRAALGL